jgi:hypothetical protein
MIFKFYRLLFLGLILIFASCSLPDANQESDMLDNVRRYIVTVGIGQDKFKENISGF